ncbi:hypothetical protein K440DRAFT_629470 [Wilcoxina mikolae CBS 423.85]|nr:hypothetical protein K440DRAFT_629470 [Wilcoxina mikolae CBS 423.85]
MASLLTLPNELLLAIASFSGGPTSTSSLLPTSSQPCPRKASLQAPAYPPGEYCEVGVGNRIYRYIGIYFSTGDGSRSEDGEAAEALRGRRSD